MATISPIDSYGVAFVGDENVGKTTIIDRFMHDKFDPKYQPSYFIKYLSKTYPIGDEAIKLMIWDAPGKEMFMSLTIYPREAAVVVVVYDISNRQSFLNVSKWIEYVRSTEVGGNATIALVANKSDLVHERQVPTEEGDAKARELGLMFVETSAKDGFNIKPLFRRIVMVMTEMKTLTSEEQEDAVNVTLKSSKYPNLNFRYIESDLTKDDTDVDIPIEVIKKGSEKFKATLYGYFVGETIAFPIVLYYVLKTWNKYGLDKATTNKEGIFFCRFKTEKGAHDVLENGPWMINNTPIFLYHWDGSETLAKVEHSKVPVWIKMHGIPKQAWTDDGLSFICSKVGKPLALDTDTSAMCVESWTKSSFARALVEVSAEQDLKGRVIVGVPSLDGTGKAKKIVMIKYEWKPSRCPNCKVFGHDESNCPKLHFSQEKVDKDGYLVL